MSRTRKALGNDLSEAMIGKGDKWIVNGYDQAFMTATGLNVNHEKYVNIVHKDRAVSLVEDAKGNLYIQMWHFTDSGWIELNKISFEEQEILEKLSR